MLECYEKKRCIQKTSHCEVWEGIDRRSQAPVVLKEYTGDYPREILERLSSVAQKNLVRFLYSIATDGGFVVVEEYVQGVPLQDMLDGGKRFDVRETVEIGLQLCSALKALHGCGIVHRDIKPSNIMMCDDGSVKLLDLHSARIHRDAQGQDTTLLGTQGYAPPEQFGFTQTDYRADLYAMGVTLYELGHGILPDVHEHFRGRLGTVFNRCLEFNPRQRLANVQQLRSLLLRAKHTVRNRIVILLCAAVLICSASALWSLWRTDLAKHEKVGVASSEQISTQGPVEATPKPIEATPKPTNVTPKPADDMPAPTDVTASLNVAQMRKINSFLTIFGEQPYFKSFDSQNYQDTQLIDFAFEYNYFYNWQKFETDDNYNCYLSAGEVDFVIERLFGLGVTPQDTPTLQYVDGKYVWPEASGVSVIYFSLADTVQDNGDGTYNVAFTVYEYFDPDVVYEDVLAYTPEQVRNDQRFTIWQQGTAVIRDAVFAGEACYQLVSYSAG